MRNDSKKLKACGRIMVIVILMSSFIPFPAFGGPPMEQQQNLNGEGTKRYSDFEINLLIDDLSAAAKEAIEKAAAEAAKAAAMAALDRETVAIRDLNHWRSEAEKNLQEVQAAKRAGRKNTFIAALIGILGGLALGVGGTIAMSR